MSDVQIGLAGIAILVGLLAVRAPIGVALIGVSFGGLWLLMGWDIAWGALGVIPYEFAANWTLSSVAMFILLGLVCYHAELTSGLFRAARVWLARLPGGLAIAALFGSAGFAAVSGSSLACSAAMGRIAVPEMIRHRYHPQLASGTVAVAGTIGALIPPSVILILYGIIAEVPITRLFMGGIGVGLLSLLGYIVVVLIRVTINPELAPRTRNDVTTAERIAALRETWPVIAIAICVLGGLMGGIFTPTESGAIGAFLSCVVGFARNSLDWPRFKKALFETLITTSSLLIIAVGASLFTRFLVLSGAGEFISSWVLALDLGPATLMIAIVAVYLVLGLFLEPMGAMLLTLPIVLPLLDTFDYSLLWFGVLLTKLLEIGMVTPPIGMNVFVVKSVAGNLVTLGDVFKGVGWFVVMDLLVVAAMIVFPSIVLFLPSVLS